MGGPAMPGGAAGGLMPNPQVATGATGEPAELADAPAQGPAEDSMAGSFPDMAAAAQGPDVGPEYQDVAQGPDVETWSQDAAVGSPAAGTMLPLEADGPALDDNYGATGPNVPEGIGYPAMQGTDAAASPAVPATPALLDPSRYAGLSNMPAQPAGDAAASPTQLTNSDISTLIANNFLPGGLSTPQAAAPAPFLGV